MSNPFHSPKCLKVDCFDCLKERNEKLEAALKRISFAKPDRLDHQLDVTIIERAAKIAKAALDGNGEGR